MAVHETETAAGFQVGVEGFERSMFDLNFYAAFTADEVMMVLFGNLINEMSAADMRGMRQSILGQELERAVDGRLGQAGEVLSGAFVDLGRRKVPARMMKYVQDGQALRRHTKAARVQLGSVLVAASHSRITPGWTTRSILVGPRSWLLIVIFYNSILSHYTTTYRDD